MSPKSRLKFRVNPRSKSRAASAVASAGSTKRDSRRRAFLDAAGKLFLTKGYGATTLHDVVRESGGSLTTLYAMFGNKAGLLRGLVEDRCEATTGVFDDLSSADRSPERVLLEYARQLFGLITSAEAVGAHRLLAAEGRESPELAEIFFKAGPDAAVARLAGYFDELARRKVIEIDDPELAARRFCGMVCAGQDLRLASGLAAAIGPEKVERHLTGAVRTFLRGHAFSPAKRK